MFCLFIFLFFCHVFCLFLVFLEINFSTGKGCIFCLRNSTAWCMKEGTIPYVIFTTVCIIMKNAKILFPFVSSLGSKYLQQI